MIECAVRKVCRSTSPVGSKKKFIFFPVNFLKTKLLIFFFLYMIVSNQMSFLVRFYFWFFFVYIGLYWRKRKKNDFNAELTITYFFFFFFRKKAPLCFLMREIGHYAVLHVTQRHIILTKNVENRILISCLRTCSLV